jgi:3-oxoacyl-[acyl-carrier-protein] synthase-3
MTTELFIAGVGVHLPERQSAQQAIAAGEYLERNMESDGVDAVCVEKALYPPEMAALAGGDALRMAGSHAGEVRAVFHASLDYQGARYWDPAPYVALHTAGPGVPAYSIRQACNAMLASIELGAGLLRNPTESVLLTSADRFDTPWVRRWYGDQSVLGDGAAAFVISRSGGFARILALETLADDALEGEGRGARFGPPDDAPLDFDGLRERFQLTAMPMAEHYQRLESLVTACIGKVLADAGVEPRDLAFALPVTATRWRIQILLQRFLGLELEQSAWSLGRTTGHMGAGDQAAGLHHLLTTGRLRTGDRVLLIGSGTGFTTTCAVLEILDPDARA